MAGLLRSGNPIWINAVATFGCGSQALYRQQSMIGHRALCAILVLFAFVAIAIAITVRPSGRRTRRTLFGSVALERIITMIAIGGAVVFLTGQWFGQPQAVRAALTCLALCGLISLLSSIRERSAS